MKKLNLRKRVANSASRAFIAFLDQSIALTMMAIPSTKAKLLLTILRVLMKVCIWLMAMGEIKANLEKNEDDDCEPP